MSDKKTSDAARETLLLLALRKLAPTPENYSAIYQEISGSPAAPHPASAAFVHTFGQAPWIAADARRELSRLASLGSWAAAFALACDASQPRPPAAPPPSRSALFDDLREQIARMAEFVLPALGADDARIGPDVAALADFCRSSPDRSSLSQLKARLAGFNHRLSFVAADQSDIRKALLDMLRMVFENLAELTMDDAWLHGQVELLMAASKPPLALRRLDDARRRITDVIFKQAELKQQNILAQNEMKRLLATFLEKLSSMADLSGAHHRRIEQCAKEVGEAKDLASIGPAITEAIAATRALSLDALRARDELAQLKKKADSSASEVDRLRHALDAASTQARHDALTGALNRKGLDEAVERELARSRRTGGPLSVAMLDIDNFKSVNDRHGHPVGDSALAHLARVVRDALRPQDTLSRFGGEEFVVLMPDTSIAGALQAMERLQRALTRQFFMAGSDNILITFSAGVAQIGSDEAPMAAISRADQGMYRAKRSGKNKVVAA